MRPHEVQQGCKRRPHEVQLPWPTDRGVTLELPWATMGGRYLLGVCVCVCVYSRPALPIVERPAYTAFHPHCINSCYSPYPH